MKTNRIISAGLVISTALLFITCDKKTQSVTNTPGPGTASAGNRSADELNTLVAPSDANAEIVRMLADVQNSDHVVAVIANPNFGSYCGTCASDTYLNGGTDPNHDISVTINNTTYHPDPAGQWMTTGTHWSGLYGTDVTVVLKSGTTVLSNSRIHVPKPCLATRLGTNGQIRRTGNTLSWTPDPNNVSGHVLLYYFLFDANGVMIADDGKLLKDNGSYSIDNLLTNSAVASIYFQLITGNTISTTVNGEKLLFYIESADQHKYTVN